MSPEIRPEPLDFDLSFVELYELVIAPIKTRLMLTAIELSVFDLLIEPGSSEDVAEILGAHPEKTRIFLDGLAAFDLLEKRGGLYSNSSLAGTFLVETSPTFVGNFLAEQWRYIEPVLDDLLGLVTKGPQELKGGLERESEDETARWAAAVANYERSGIASMVAGLMGELPEFRSFRKMLDLGGGPGLIGMAVVASHPTMRGVIFDLPPVAKLAEKFISEAGMEDRMEVVSGDICFEPIGEKYDLILASASLYSCKGDLDSVMEKVHAALNSGGVFASLHEGLTCEMTKPEIMKLGWLPAEL
ncbi:methyltransferase, partial [Methanocrinis sp.]|uniref:methyltransferase n=1 Tax=Methanocrinis sp. TaxID=3101522 RepID=UPI003D0FB431